MNEELTVLVVEDNPADLDIVLETLSETGPVRFKVESASRLSGALDRLEGGGIDVVLLDLGLPDSQGLGTLRAVASAAPHVPIVVFTGHDDEETGQAAAREGAQDYLVKGLIPERMLARVVRFAVERKRAEKKLQDQNRFLQILIDAIPLSIFYKGTDGIYAGCNKAYAQFLGLSKEEIIGKGVYDIFPKDIADIYYQRDAALFHKPGIQQYEAKMNHADGTIHDVLFTKATYEDEDDGVAGLIGAMLDITERKRAEAERERLLAAIEQAGEVIVITDPAGTIQYVNPAFETVTGYTREEAVGQTPRILKSGRQDEAFYRKLWETISSGRTWEGRMVNKRKDGTLYTEDATISPVRDAAGRIVNYVAVKRDITEHLQLADQFQQAQKMESVGRLAGGVAHDFNNMLGVILGYAEMALYEAGPGTPLHDNLTEIRKAAQRSADLTRQLLAFARKQTIDPRVLDLNSTVEGMLNMLRRLIGEDIDLAWLPGADLWPVKMDPAQIDQILANLCVNARDAIADVGKVTIETQNVSLDEAYCAAHAGFAPGEFVMLTVSDDGCGMDEETQRRLFEPFFTTKEIGKGTGLGLSTVYGIVKQNDGFINVYSEPGQGTTFRIYIPRHAAGMVETRATIAAELPQGHGETVLLVEDEPAMLNMGKGMLEKLGYTVLTAATPGEAMRLAEEHAGEIHLLMTDVVMPEMNGRDLAEAAEIPLHDPQVPVHVRLHGQRHRPPRGARRGRALHPEAVLDAGPGRQGQGGAGRE